MATVEKKNMASSDKTAMVNYFVESFYRVFKIGIYYPVGHVVLDQAASKCIQQLREVALKASTIEISIDKTDLFVDEEKILDNLAAKKELHHIFYNLGVRKVLIDRTVAHNEILTFVKSLLNWRMELESTQSIISFKVDDLPPSIRVQQQEFVVDEASIRDEAVENEGSEKLDQLCASLGEQGLSEEQVGQCRDLLLTFSKVSTSKRIDLNGFPNATWDDVQGLLYQIVTGAYSQETGQFRAIAKNDINVLSSIFLGLERGLVDAQSKETIQFLVSHLTGRGEVEESYKKEERMVTSQKVLKRYERDKLPIPEIKKYVYENNIPVSVLGQLTQADRSEQLSIYLQLIVSSKKRELVEQIIESVQKIISTDLNEREYDVLIGGVKLVADFGSIDLFGHIFKLVLRTLRESHTGRSLEFIVDFWAKMPHTSHLLLWPYVVNELLVVGMDEKKKSFLEVLEIASHMHRDGMKSMKPQLEGMEAFNQTEIADAVFRPSYIYSYPLYAFLFETSIVDTVSEKVLESLKKEPQDHLMEAVAPILLLEQKHHAQFLYNYLLQAHQKEPPLSLKMAGGEIILDHLKNITDEQRESEFIEKIILATSSFYTKGIKEMLGKIISEKKAVVVPVWPKKCRKAAETALKGLKRVSVSELF